MNILFCSPCRLDARLGAAQTLLALAEEMNRLGCSCRVIGPETLDAEQGAYPEQLAAYLTAHAADYDVVEFDYKRLPFVRHRFDPRVLFVARCQLLKHHVVETDVPPLPDAGSRLRAWLGRPLARRRGRRELAVINTTLREADRVIVLNGRDRGTLAANGVAPEKVWVLPNGLPAARRAALEALPAAPPAAPVVAFIGMFGPRKGGGDLPALVRRIAAAVPDVRFKLLGTRGYLRTADAVLAYFPRALRNRIEVVPVYPFDELPALLASCSVGIFPSYAEGFGLGVLEMLAAAMPVVAYDAPGPPEMLPPPYLVPPGDTDAMSDRVVTWLRDPDDLAAARRWARDRSRAFTWPDIAARTVAHYTEALAQVRVQESSSEG